MEDFTGATAQSDDVRQATAYELQAQELIEALTTLDETAALLERRLAPILYDEEAVPSDPEEPLKAVDAAHSPVVTQIASFKNRVDRTTDRLRLVLRRLEL